MYRILFISIILLLGSVSQAQTVSSLSKKEQRKLLREEKKEQAAKEEALNMKLVEQMVNEATFVLEADMLFNKYGESRMVQSDINFILVDSLYGIIQIGSMYYLGQNGVGGITIEGNVTNYKVKKNEKKNTYSVSFSVRSPAGTYEVSLTTLGGKRGDARVNGNFSGSIRYSGRLVHPSKSRVFKGTSL